MSLSSIFGAHQEVGRLVRHHGCDGEMMLLSTGILDDSLEDLESLFIWIDQLPVPFFIKSLRFTGDNSAIIQFEEVPNRDDAAPLIGCEVTCLAGETDIPILPQGLDTLVGFSVSDADGTPIGTVEAIFDFKSNIVLEVLHNGDTVRLPFHPDLILQFDEKNKQLTMTVPEGLLG